MDFNRYRGGNFLSPADVQKNPVWTVDGAKETEIDGKVKAQLILKDDKGMSVEFTLNATNIARLEHVFKTTDSDKLKGKRLILKVVPVDYKGKMVDGIRVDTKATEELQKQDKLLTPTDVPKVEESDLYD